MNAVILNQRFAVSVDDLLADPAASLLPPPVTTSPPSTTITWGSATIDTYKPRKPTDAEQALVGTVFEHDGQFWKLFYVNYHLGNHCVTAWLEAVTVEGNIVRSSWTDSLGTPAVCPAFDHQPSGHDTLDILDTPATTP